MKGATRALYLNGERQGEVFVANTFWRRLLGVFRLSAAQRERGLMIEPCRAVHGLGLRESLDVLFLDAGGAVLRVSQLKPWLMCACQEAASVIEFPVGQASRMGIVCGDVVSCVEIDDEQNGL